MFRSGHYSSSGKVNVYPADNNGHVLWRRGKTVDASKILDPSVLKDAPEAPLYSAPVILRIGSTGDAVALVQKKVGVEADGWLGLITEAAVKDYQRSEGLVPDGIVGPITMKAMRLCERVTQGGVGKLAKRSSRLHRSALKRLAQMRQDAREASTRCQGRTCGCPGSGTRVAFATCRCRLPRIVDSPISVPDRGRCRSTLGVGGLAWSCRPVDEVARATWPGRKLRRLRQKRH